MVQSPAPRPSAADRPLLNSYWVIPGRLLAGEHPVVSDRTESRDRVGRLRQANLDSFIDLTQPGEQPDYRHWLGKRDDYQRFAIVDGGVPQTVSETLALLEHLRRALASRRGVYVHCRAGIGRTGLAIGCYLAELGGDGRAALEQLNALWGQSGRASSWPRVPQTPQQADYIRRWPDLRKLHPTTPQP